MLAEILVTVVIDGRAIVGSRPAVLCESVVVAPLDPYVRRLADGIAITGAEGRMTITRGDATIVVAIGSRRARDGRTDQTLPIAPFLRDGEPNIPLAAIARALGATVGYDRTAHAISIAFPRKPLATMTPFGAYVAPSSPVTFSPASTSAPRPVVTGIPHPRRTPILIQGPSGEPARVIL